VVARGDHVDARAEEELGGGCSQAHPAGKVLAVGRDEIDPASAAQVGQERLDREAAGLADDVADQQDAAGAGRARRIPVGGVAEADAAMLAYFAYSTARVSRITVTLIWPG
jgi:hypothetical protein